MIEYITNTLADVATQPLGLLFALCLGFASAIASACCTLPAIGVLVGYSGAQVNITRRDVGKTTLLFMLGTIAALMIIGLVAGFVGQVAQASLGQYWKLFAGLIAVFLGLATLKLLPFKLSLGSSKAMPNVLKRLGPGFAGLALGGIVAVSSLPCNPGIFIVMGIAVLHGAAIWAGLLLGLFALGFAIPLALIMFGISMGKFSLAAKGADTVIRWIAGIVLLIAGFYFLITF